MLIKSQETDVSSNVVAEMGEVQGGGGERLDGFETVLEAGFGGGRGERMDGFEKQFLRLDLVI